MFFVTTGLFLSGLMVWGLLISRGQRAIDRGHFATFVGFISGLIAVTVTTLVAIVGRMQGHVSPYHMSPARVTFNVVASILTFTSIPLTFLAGLFSRGIQRIALIGCSVGVSLMVLLNVTAHFGD